MGIMGRRNNNSNLQERTVFRCRTGMGVEGIWGMDSSSNNSNRNKEQGMDIRLYQCETHHLRRHLLKDNK